MFRSIPHKIVDLAVVKYPWDQTEETPKPTGILPHVLHMVEMEKLSKEMTHLKTDLIAELKKVMDTLPNYP